MEVIRKIIVSLLSAVFIICTAACQPTPEQPVVVQRGETEAKINSQYTDEPVEKFEVPSHWNDTIEGEKLTININADVMIPDVNQYPVVKLEPAVFTQQQVNEMANYFSGGNKLYLPHEKTKADYD